MSRRLPELTMDTSEKPEVDEFTDSSSDSSALSEEWQDLSKSDFAKVIFCDMSYDAQTRSIGCKFQITDNVHEDPSDYVGLFKIGNQTQCIVSKMLSETECEEDGKLLRCNFSSEDLPQELQDGFYHFQYVTRDGEVCGASTPIEVKQQLPKEDSRKVDERAEKKYIFRSDDSSDEDVVAESAENDFVLVEHILEKKNRMLEELLEKFRAKNLALSSDMEVLLEAKSKLCQEKEEIIENLHQEILSLKTEFARKDSTISEKDNKVKYLALQVQSCEITITKCREDLDTMAKLLEKSEQEKLGLHNEVRLLKEVIKDKDNLPAEPEKRILLEQLEDQKFMIRALEDSKHLALQEMSDLSESLSKRTKVLNQTRSELASCKLKLKESISDAEKKNEDISRLKEQLAQLNKLVLNRPHCPREVPPQNLPEVTLACQYEDEIELSRPIQELYNNAIKRAEGFMVLIDKLIKGTDFNEMNQKKLFHNLKIMLFIMLGKMKRPKDSLASKESSPRVVSRVLPSRQGQTSSDISDNIPMPINVTEIPQKDVTPKTEVKVCKPPEISVRANDLRGYLGHEMYKSNFDRITELLEADMHDVKFEHRSLFNNLWKDYNARNKCVLKDSANDPISVLLPCSTRESPQMTAIDRVLFAISTQLNKDKAPLKETFLQILKESINIEILLKYVKEEHETATSEQIEELEKEIKKLQDNVAKLTTQIDDLIAGKTDISKKLEESNATVVELKEEIAKKDEATEKVHSEKNVLLENEVLLKETVKEHAARISEAAELYKKQYVEIEKLKKKIRHAHRARASWPKAVGYESSSNNDEEFPFKSSEKAPPTKRARKATAKAVSPKKSEKASISKTADKQPEMLKVILKSFAKDAEKLCKMVSPSKSEEKLSAETKSAADVKETLAEKAPECHATDKECQPPDDIWLSEKELIFHTLREFSCIGKGPQKKAITKSIKLAPARCVSDSDTGEHVLKNTTVPSTETITFSSQSIPSDVAPATCEYRLQSLPEDLDRSKSFPVYISAVHHPEHFYIQMIGPDTTDALNTLYKDLYKFYNGSSSYLYQMKLRDAKENAVCAVFWAQDSSWCRARIIAFVPPQSVEVFLVDCGAQETVPLDMVRYLKDVYTLLPAQAIKSRLAHLKPPNGAVKYNDQAKERMLDLCMNFKLVAKIKNKQNEILSLILYDTRNYRNIFINTVLVVEGYAAEDHEELKREGIDLKEMVASNLRSLTESCRDGIPLDTLERMYIYIFGIDIPFKDHGFSCLESFLKSISHAVTLKRHSDGLLRAIAAPYPSNMKAGPSDKKQTCAAANLKPYEDLCDEKPVVSPIIEYFKSLEENQASPKVDSSFEPGNRDLRTVHQMLKQKVSSAIGSAESKVEKFSIPCVLCEKTLTVSEDISSLMDHLENDHQISMCPICGQLFEASFPRKYLMYHVEDHFKSK